MTGTTTNPYALNDRVCIVTGAAAGINRAVALRFAQLGAKVALLDIDAAGLDSVKAAIGESSIALRASVLSHDEVTDAAEETCRIWGKIDVLVNGVGGSTGPGFPSRQTMAEMPTEYWDATMDLNLTSAVRCIRAVLPHMQRRGSGRIINYASLASYGALQEASVAYAAAKAGIVALTKRLAHEVGPDGITVNAIAPGHTATERVKKFVVGPLSEESRRAMEERIPLRRLATPEEQADVVAFLASDAAAYVNGAVIDVNGGSYL